MRTILIDDEHYCNDVLSEMIKVYCPQLTIVDICTTYDAGIKSIQHLKPDVVFLDIELGSYSGIDLLKSLHPIDCEVIFVTAHAQYALQAIQLSALDYLLKPVTADALTRAAAKGVNRTYQKQMVENYQFFFDTLKRQQTQANLERIALPNHQHMIEYVYFKEIKYVEADKQYSVFHLNDTRKIIVSKGLSEYVHLLEPQGFLRVHRSYIVNEKYIKQYIKSDEQLVLNDSTKISVAKGLKNDVLRRLSA